MQIGEKLHGFTVRDTRPLEEIGATMVEMTYEKNGARLIWLDRGDPNMTFAITFKTVPEDDTGVFHILEHSVLCGSERYPVKEPFVNLLQSSLQTFLNAMTFPDKTMYPVATRNKKDFLNLISVYMDAVLHPLIYQKEQIFRQEGWHYEWQDDGRLVRNGVVYNEMKGAYGSVETQIGAQMDRLLYPDTCYRYDSGGSPEAIPQLTYEQFLESHRRFYHPSNAYIVLDGEVDIDAVLALLDSFLRDYGRADLGVAIPPQAVIAGGEITAAYDAGEQAQRDELCYWSQGYVLGRYDELEKAAALRILGDVLCGSNEAPLKKAVVESGLAENVDFSGQEDATCYLQADITVKNARRGDIPRLEATIEDTLRGLAENGLDREMLAASINSLEFFLRERDFGSTPKGLVFAFYIMDHWLYGGDPAAKLCYGDLFDRLRRRAEEGYFEELIRTGLLENPHRGKVLLTPCAGYGARQSAAAQRRLDALAAGWSEQEKARVAAQAEALHAAQQREDSPEELATLPHLRLADVSEKPEKLLLEETVAKGVRILSSPYDTSGIVYAELYFDISDLTEEELAAASLLANVLDEVGTRSHTAEEVQKLLKLHLGAFSCHVEVYGRLGRPEEATPYLVVGVSVLEDKLARAAELLRELLSECRMDNRRVMRQVLRQKKLDMREAVTENGTVFAAGRVAAAFTAQAAIAEHVAGIEQYRFLCRMDDTLEADPAALETLLGGLYARVFVRERLSLGLTGHPAADFAGRLIDMLPQSGRAVVSRVYARRPVKNEGIIVPTDVAFTALGANLYSVGKGYRGSMSPAAALLSYGYLWNVVRVQNGAYGAGLSVGDTGTLRFTSYRDPNAAAALDAFRAAADHLRQAPPDEEELSDLIISVIGDTEPLRTPRTAGKTAQMRRLIGAEDAHFEEVRRQILRTTPAQVLAFADDLDAVCRSAASCVVGSRALIEQCGARLSEITRLD